MKITHYILFVLLLLAKVTVGQFSNSLELSEELHEISGIEVINDTTLVAINDGGNEAAIFILELNGKIRKKIDLQSAKNIDWEDITSDGVHLYIADFGNNSSSRKELTIYKLNIEELLTEESPAFEIILYSYKEQIDDKPQDNLFDAEALAYHNDSLWIITKPNPKKWSGNAVIYKAPVIPGKYTLAHSGTLFTGSDSWISDAVTGADFHNGKLYVTTYNRVIQFNFAENKLLQSNFWGYNEPSQMESIATKSDGTIVLANEKNRLLGGGNLYYLRIDVDNH